MAFSRDNPNTRTYVQDLMQERKDLVVRVLQQEEGCLFICGNTKMGLDVQNLLKEFIGEEAFKTLEKEKRLVKELWG